MNGIFRIYSMDDKPETALIFHYLAFYFAKDMKKLDGSHSFGAMNINDSAFSQG